MSKLNPQYDTDKLGLDSFTLVQPDLSYEFNELMFFRRRDNGLVYSASSAGCSCPTPFEEYEGDDVDEVCQQMERVGSLEQAQRIIESFAKDYDGKYFLDQGERAESLQRLREWGLT